MVVVRSSRVDEVAHKTLSLYTADNTTLSRFTKISHDNQSYIRRAAQSVLGVYLKRTCSRVTSASSGVNNGSMGHGSVGQIDCRVIMPKLRSTYDGRLVYQVSYEERKAFLGYDLLAKS